MSTLPEHDARPVIAAFGEWDTANLGDRAIRRAIERFYAEAGWRVHAYNLGSLRASGAVATSTESGTSTSRRTLATRLLVPGVKRMLRGVRQDFRMRTLMPALAAADAIAVGGGALLSDANLHFPQSLSVLAEAARKLDKPLLCLGCSAEGDWSRDGAARVTDFLRACRVVAVRDESTARRVSAALGRSVPVFGDFCLSAPRTPERASPASGVMVLNVCKVALPWGGEQTRYENGLVAVAREWAARADGAARAVTLFTTGTADDIEPLRRVHARLEGIATRLALPDRLDALEHVFTAADIVIASRLHGAILAMAAGAPVIGISPAPKLMQFFRTMGIADYCCDPEEGVRISGLLDHHRAVFEDQRHAIERAAVWAVRDDIQAELRARACGVTPPSSGLAKPIARQRREAGDTAVINEHGVRNEPSI